MKRAIIIGATSGISRTQNCCVAGYKGAVARQITQALKHKRRVAIIDTRYRVLVFFWRLIPRWLWKRLPVQV